MTSSSGCVSALYGCIGTSATGGSSQSLFPVVNHWKSICVPLVNHLYNYLTKEFFLFIHKTIISFQ